MSRPTDTGCVTLLKSTDSGADHTSAINSLIDDQAKADAVFAGFKRSVDEASPIHATGGAFTTASFDYDYEIDELEEPIWSWRQALD